MQRTAARAFAEALAHIQAEACAAAHACGRSKVRLEDAAALLRAHAAPAVSHLQREHRAGVRACRRAAH